MDSRRPRTRWDLSPPTCLTRWDSTPEGSETMVTPTLGSPSHDITNENGGGNANNERQYSSYFLQHLIDRCRKISKSDTVSSRNADTDINESYLTNWNRKRKRQRIDSEQGSSSHSSDEEFPVLKTRKKVKRISSDSDSRQYSSRSSSVSRPRRQRSRSSSDPRSKRHRSRSSSDPRSRRHRSRSSSDPRSRRHRSRSTSVPRSRRHRSRSSSVPRSRRHRSRSSSVPRSKRHRSRSSSVPRSRRHRSRSSSVPRSRSQRSRSDSHPRSRRHRSRSNSRPRSWRHRSRSSSDQRPRRYRSRSSSSGSSHQRSKSSESRSSIEKFSRAHRSRSLSATRSEIRKSTPIPRRSRSTSQSSVRCRARSTSAPRRQRSSSRSVSRARICRSRSRSRSVLQNKQGPRTCRSISSSDSASVSGRRSWLKYRYRSPVERNEQSVSGSSVRKSYARRTRSSSSSSSSPSRHLSADEDKACNIICSSSTLAKSGVDTEVFPFVVTEDIKYFKRLLNTSSSSISRAELDKRQFIGHLLKIRNGPPQVAKESTKAIQKLAKRMDCCVLFNTLLPICAHVPFNMFGNEAFPKMVAVIDAIIFRMGRRVCPFVHKILVIVECLLGAPLIRHQMLAVRVITKLTKIVGLKGMLPIIRKDLDSKDVYAIELSCRSLAVVTSVVGIGNILPFIQAVCASKESAGIQKAGFLLIKNTVHVMKEKAHPYIKQLMEVLQTASSKIKPDMHTEWAEAVAALVNVAHKEDTPIFILAWDTLLPIYKKSDNMGKVRAALQKAVFSILHLKSEATEQELEDVCGAFRRSCSSFDEQLRKNNMQVMYRLSRCTYMSDDMYDNKFMRPVIRHFIDKSVAYDDTAKEQFAQVCVRSVRKVGVSTICTYIHHGLNDPDEVVSKMVAVILATVLQKYGLKDLTYSIEKEIIIQFCHALNKQTSKSTSILTSFLSVIKLLGCRLYSHIQDIQQVLMFDKTSCSPQQSKLLEKIQSVIIGGGSGMDGSSGLVMDGCVWNMTEIA